MRSVPTACLALALALAGLAPGSIGVVAAADAKAPKKPPVIDVKTNLGTFTVELWPDKAPQTVNNFLGYVLEGHYDGTIFQRVVKGFVIQGGNLTPDGSSKPTRPPIPLEAKEPNRKYTIAMARTKDPNSATDQFYVNLADNTSLDAAVRMPGYAVFGRVIRGTNVVDQIASQPVDGQKPVTNVVIERVSISK